MPPKRRAAAKASAGAPSASKKPRTAGTGGVGDRTVRWEWEGDGGKWTRYAKVHSDALTSALEKKKNQINIDVAPKVTMVLQLEEGVQKNKKTGFERRIRMAIKDPKDGDFYAWQWQDEKGKWNPYPAAVSLDLEDAQEKKLDEVTFEACHRSYTVDMATLKQENSVTHVKRDVERSKSDAEAAEGEEDEPVASSSAVNVKEEEEEEEEEPAPKKGRGKGSSGKSAAKSGRGKKGEENGAGDSKSVVRQVVVSKGSAPVDAECPLVEKCRVHEANSTIWDCMLNQTNVGNNNNKYYIIQLLEETSKKVYYVWQRWGRVGYKGQTNLVNTGGDLDKAKNVFDKKFFDKTKNAWNNRHMFHKVPGKYDLVHLDYSAKGEDQLDAGDAEDEGDSQAPESKLHLKVKDLVKLICDVKSMEEAVVEMKYDAKKAPLGKLTKKQIKAGYEALKEVETLINQKDFGRNLTDACSIFYTRIPHDFGMRTPPLIRTPKEVKEKLQLLEALEDIEYAIKMLKEGDKSENPVDRHYHSLACGLSPLDQTADNFKLVDEYLQKTHASTHNQYKMKLLEVFEVDKDGEKANYLDHGNRMLLWHGSRLTNWAGILGQGLRIAPPEAPVTGYMFGKGVYFADMSSKSANYCFASRQKNIGLMLLCDVSLGNINEKLDADYYADKLPSGKHSVKGCGSVGPDPSTFKTLPDGLVVPVGKGTNTGVKNPKGYTLNYNEFIVYNTAQIRMKYLLKVQFNFK
ncbi:poly [ADP-ribose] polymerase 2-like [Babylonia areolata]|uniref:poly [ADP-ribose] polymerase 2-like n=1 Tax=Babylonia areolata TaxID=304850 RepID=UPI003FD0A688